MGKTFCIGGPIRPEKHYYLPFRMSSAELMLLIDEEKYFILHAPRQSGKTTAMQWLVNTLNASDTYEALYVNIEAAQADRENYEKGISTVLKQCKLAILEYFGSSHQVLAFFNNDEWRKDPASALVEFLQYWSTHNNKPVILFMDEIDALIGDTLISVLRQLRTGYAKRPKHFPQSVCLIGLRDVRDYRIYSSNEKQMVLGGSAFNIKAESLTIHNFSMEEVRALYLQHAAATGQQFTDEAITYAFVQTQGQPWLVNALAYQACFRDVLDRGQSITLKIMQHAREKLVLRRDTHLDQLIHKLKEDRVRRVIDPLIAGGSMPINMNEDDLQYVRDLGLVTQKGIAIANPIYQEVIPRALTSLQQENVPNKPAWYLNKDGSFNTKKVLEDWVQFYREHSGMWAEQFDYKEAGPHLLMFAFLQRVVNGGGSIQREYALGRKRVDLVIHFGTQRIAIELKLMHDNRTLPQGLEQTAEYMDIVNATEGYLIIFDQNKAKSWEEKVFQHDKIVGSKTIHVWGM
jgi:hypothetical protein